jgi:hypothetical protein
MQFFRSSFLIIGLFWIICLGPFKRIFAQDTLEVIWINQVGNNGYLSSDFMMDSQIDNADKNEFRFLNQGYSSPIPE